MADENRRAQYKEVALAYLGHRGEEVLYRASLLSKEFMKVNVGPDEIVQLHFEVLDEILGSHEPTEHREIVSTLSALLLEAMMAYADTNQKIADLLAELRHKYTELEKSQSELEQSQHELHETTSQLIQSEKMTALGELAASVVHEVNQPLNAMKLICEDILRDIAKDRLEVDELEESLGEVTGEVRKLADIVDHMRVFSRRSAGSRRESVDVGILVRGALTFLSQDFSVRSIEVDTLLTEGTVVVGDPVRLEQIVMNLLTNARDAVVADPKPEGKRIRIRSFPHSESADSRRQVVLEVRDNGAGIPEEILGAIFDPFVTTKEPGSGTGLGLSVSKRIVKEHGGVIEVDSEVGRGTEFRITLPAAEGGR